MKYNFLIHLNLNLDGPELPHPFGLDVFGNYIYWTDWQTLNIERADKITGLNRTVLVSGITDLMDVRVFHRNRTVIRTSCGKNNGGCTHLCLLRPKNNHACACPTGIKLGVSINSHKNLGTRKSVHIYVPIPFNLFAIYS